MSDEETAIQDGFKEQLQGMFQVFFQSTLTDGLDAAAARFSVGLDKLRAARQRALQVVTGAPAAAAGAKRP
jgi:hypothetical protein